MAIPNYPMPLGESWFDTCFDQLYPCGIHKQQFSL